MSTESFSDFIDEPFADEAQLDPDDFPDQPQAPQQRGRGKRGPAKPMPPRRYSPEWNAIHARSAPSPKTKSAPLRPEPFRPASAPAAPARTVQPQPDLAPAASEPERLGKSTKSKPFTCVVCGTLHEEGGLRARYCPQPAPCRRNAYLQRSAIIQGGDPLRILRLAIEAEEQGESTVVRRCHEALLRELAPISSDSPVR